MSKIKRQRAVVVALIALLCAAAFTTVAVDRKRFGGGFLAFFKGRGSKDAGRVSGDAAAGASGARSGFDETTHARGTPSPLRLTAAAQRQPPGSGGHPSEDDLFKYGDPAAGGIPTGSFIVARNETPGGGSAGESPAPAGASAAPEASGGVPSGAESAIGGGSGGGGGAGTSSPAPVPAGGTSGDGGILIGKVPTPPAPPTATPPAATPRVATPPATTPPAATPPVGSPPRAATPPAPATSPIADTPAATPSPSGLTDQNPGDRGTEGHLSGSGTPAPLALPPVSAVPETSSREMMGLGALFLAVAATRRRQTD